MKKQNYIAINYNGNDKKQMQHKVKLKELSQAERRKIGRVGGQEGNERGQPYK